MSEFKFRVWDKVDYMSTSFTLKDLQIKRVEFTDDCPVMLWSGILDKNGKEIFNGDIVKVDGQFEVPCTDKKDFEIITYQHLGKVVFDGGMFLFKNHLTRNELIEHKKHFPESDTDVETSLAGLMRIEVIGNIYENPELLPK